MTLDTIELYTREEMRDGWMGHPIHGCRKAWAIDRCTLLAKLVEWSSL
jgi:hypothetical protein